MTKQKNFRSFTRRVFFAFAVAALALSLSSPAQATKPATDFIAKLGDQALSSLTAKNLSAAERETRVRRLLRNNFDIRTIGRFALGPNWRHATEAQRKEYFSLFENMIVRTYAQRFGEYSGQSFKVGTAVKSGDTDYIVNSQILQNGGPPVNVKWRVRKSDRGLRVIDVFVEDISMSMTQRSDFQAVIQRGGGKVEVLLEALRKRKVEAK